MGGEKVLAGRRCGRRGGVGGEEAWAEIVAAGVDGRVECGDDLNGRDERQEDEGAWWQLLDLVWMWLLTFRSEVA